ncbi:MAG: DoxX family protein [Candidatus Angelobacter sp.]
MAEQPHVALVPQEEPIQAFPSQETQQETKPWSPALRLAFRFSFAYFILYSFSDAIIRGLLISPHGGVPSLGAYWPLAHLTTWTAQHVFRIGHPVKYALSGSGDTAFDWVQNFCILVIAIAATAIWSFLDRRREQYVSLHKWFHVFMRFALSSELIAFGANKFFLVQMGFPSLTKLLEPYGNFSLRGVLWSSVGASPAYEVFTGSAELLAGILLIFPRTATLGALVALADMIQVFTLNMTYDVPVKLFSFHLILFSLFLLAPEMRRLVTFFFTDSSTLPSEKVPLFRSVKAMRIAVAAQIIFGLYLLGVNFYANAQYWKFVGPNRLKPSLYGIWNVDRMWIDGVERSPLLTDYDRWRRVIFDSRISMQFQRMDDAFGAYRSATDDKAKKITLTKFDNTLTKFSNKEWIGELIFDRPAQDRLMLDGTVGGHKTKMELKLVELDKFMLVNSGFHWINEEKPVVHLSNSLD